MDWIFLRKGLFGAMFNWRIGSWVVMALFALWGIYLNRRKAATPHKKRMTPDIIVTEFDIMNKRVEIKNIGGIYAKSIRATRFNYLDKFHGKNYEASLFFGDIDILEPNHKMMLTFKMSEHGVEGNVSDVGIAMILPHEKDAHFQITYDDQDGNEYVSNFRFKITSKTGRVQTIFKTLDTGNKYPKWKQWLSGRKDKKQREAVLEDIKKLPDSRGPFG